MRLLRSLLVVLLCLAPTASQPFWQSRDSNYNVNIVSGGGGFTGPGDIQSFTFWGGLRAYSAATRGTKAINVCNVADAVCADLSTDATTGALVVSTIGGSSCAVVACTVKIIYDKVGTADCTQTTIANRPVLTQNALNTSWGMTFTAASTQGFQCGAFTATQPYSFAMIVNPSGSTCELFNITDGSFNGALNEWSSAGPNLRMYGGNNFDVAMTSAFHAFQSVFNGVSSISAQDGVETTGNAGAQSISALTMGISRDPFGGYCNAVGMEYGYVAGTVSPGNRTSLNSNMHAAYGSW